MKAHERVITDQDGTKLYGFHFEDAFGIVIGLYALSLDIDSNKTGPAAVFFQVIVVLAMSVGLWMRWKRDERSES